MQNIGDKLRFLRSLYGYSQEAVANELNITQKTYSRFENDEVPLNPERTAQSADFYKIGKLELHRFLETDPKVIIQKIAETNNGAFTTNGSVVQNQGFTEKEREILFEQIKTLNGIIQDLREENKRLRDKN